MTKEKLALIRGYLRSQSRHNASNTVPGALTYLRLVADALEQAWQEGDALKEKLAERKIHGKCSCWRCLGCPSDPYADDEKGPEQSKGEAMTMEEARALEVEAYKALLYLYVAVEESIAEDVNAKVKTYIRSILQERDEAIMQGKAKPC